MDTERQVSTIVLWTWLAWGSAIWLTITGTIIGCSWAHNEEAVMVAFSVLAFAILAVAAAVCLSVCRMIRKQTGIIVGIVATRVDADRRVTALRQ